MENLLFLQKYGDDPTEGKHYVTGESQLMSIKISFS